MYQIDDIIRAENTKIAMILILFFVLSNKNTNAGKEKTIVHIFDANIPPNKIPEVIYFLELSSESIKTRRESKKQN